MEIFDLHCDTIGECANKKINLRENDLHISLKKGENFDKWAQFFAVWIPDELSKEQAYNYFLKVLDYFKSEISENNLSLNAPLIELKDNICNPFLSIEGGRVLGGSLEKIDELSNLGVKMMTLTWNGECEIGYGQGAMSSFGLKSFGKDAVKRMQEKNMVVDISHLNDKGFFDVASIAQKPFIASHSNSRKICNHLRNLTDEQIKIIIEFGGLIGINFYNLFLSEKRKSGFESVYEHIYHILDIGGENVLALGSDFDGAEMTPELNSVDKLSALYQYLSEKGITKSLLDKIFFKNSYEFFLKVLH